MSMIKSRRQFLLALAAAGAAGAAGVGGSWFLSRPSLAQVALAGSGPRAGSKPKVVFVVLADGLGTENFGGASGTVAADKLALWHPWDGTEGNSTLNKYVLGQSGWEATNPLLAGASSVLEPYKKRSLYIRGTRVGATSNSGHTGHEELLNDNNRTLPSIDQILGEQLPGLNPGLGTLFAGDIRHNKNFTVSWAGAGTAAAIEFNPRRLFNTVFPGVARGPRAAGGAHVFDAAVPEINALKADLTGPERQKLDVHLDAVEKVVADLENGGGGPIEGCDPREPEMEDAWLGDVKTRPQVLAGHAQVIAAALSCGLVRVATLQVGSTSEETTIFADDSTQIGNAHQCAHQTVGGGGEHNVPYWRNARVWYLDRLKHFLDQLNGYADPDMPGDSLLDHTLVVVTSELSDGLPEHQYDMPLLLIGGEKSFGTMTGDGQGRAINIRYQTENHPADQYQIFKDHVKMSRIWHSIAAAAGVASGYDAPEAAGPRGCAPVAKLFSGIS